MAERGLNKDLLPDDLEKDLLSLSMCGLMACLLASFATRWLWPGLHAQLLTIASGLLTWMVALGISRAAAQGVHVRVGFLADIASPTARKRAHILADIVFLIAVVAIFLASSDAALSTFDTSLTRGHPLVFIAMPFGMVLTAIRLCQRLHRSRKGGSCT